MPQDRESRLELLQFPYSHYNEKVRWALDYKRIPHRRRNLLPGPHALTITRLTGQTLVPVVRFDGSVVHGSARIIDELEQRHPEPPLYPAAPDPRKRALGIQEWFDTEIGPKVRRALFSVLLDEPDYVCLTFSEGRGSLQQRLYRAGFPVTKQVMKKSMGIAGPDSVGEAYEATREALDFVAKQAGPEGHLVGDRFGVADLSAAALLAPAVMPPDSPMSLPEPRPAAVVRWLEGWAGHPGADWVLGRYRAHRPPSSALD